MMIDDRPGSVELQLDTSPKEEASPKGWYKPRVLPHFDQPGLFQSITYRLADSIPASAVVKLEKQIKDMEKPRADTERRRRMENLIDAGHGSCILKKSEAAECVVAAWMKFDQMRYDLIAWIVMPNHVHICIKLNPDVSLGKVVQSWKSFTARMIKPLILESMKSTGQAYSSSQVWMRDY